MTDAVYNVIFANRLNLALTAGDSGAATWSTSIIPMVDSPQLDTNRVETDGNNGVWGIGQPDVTAHRIAVYPFARQALSGQQFSVRLFGWRYVGSPSYGLRTWVPVPLVELLCTVGDATGVNGPGPPVDAGANYCTSITVSDGALGPAGNVYGEVLQFANTTLYPAAALIELRGVEKWQFDFQQVDPVQMNALWARM